MSGSINTDRLLEWLNQNGHWDDEVLEIRASPVGGVGVFVRDEVSTEDVDQLLLRIPKSSILSCKNSYIYNLLLDYQELLTLAISENTVEEDDTPIDLTAGMHGLVLAVIYELDAGVSSPWYEYLHSIDFGNASTPVCLWSETGKKLLRNTEVDLLGMLSAKELTKFFKVCCAFAEASSSLVDTPSILSSSESGKIAQFGKVVTSVISRAFDVDDFHGLSLVPGADLFNHKSPSYSHHGIKGGEDVHFMSDNNSCLMCGEVGCADHGSETGSESGDSESETNGTGSETGGDDESDDEIGDDEDDMQVDLAITLEDIALLEQELEEDEESEAETDKDDDECLTISDPKASNGVSHTPEAELALELADSSKCCDIALVNTEIKPGMEVFNTYGNGLSNPYLLQRYGFVSANNPNNTVSLSVQMFRYLKNLRQGLSKGKESLLQVKLDWFEEVGFDLVNDIEAERRSCHHDHDHSEGHEHEHEHHDDDEDEYDPPESWPLAVRIDYPGTLSVHACAFIQLLQMPYKNFELRFRNVTKPAALVANAKRHLIEESPEVLGLAKRWCQEKLRLYSPLDPNDTLLETERHLKIIHQIIDQEQKMLATFITKL